MEHSLITMWVVYKLISGMLAVVFEFLTPFFIVATLLLIFSKKGKQSDTGLLAPSEERE